MTVCLGDCFGYQTAKSAKCDCFNVALTYVHIGQNVWKILSEGVFGTRVFMEVPLKRFLVLCCLAYWNLGRGYKQRKFPHLLFSHLSLLFSLPLILIFHSQTLHQIACQIKCQMCKSTNFSKGCYAIA